MLLSDTKRQIIRAAESLFARQGYSGTSLREITDLAGVNIAAVNYHFGSKEKLLIGILDDIVVPITSRRLELLDAGLPQSFGVRGILDAFLRPDLEAIEQLRKRDPQLPKFVARMYTEGSDVMRQVIGRQFAENQERFVAEFERVLPGVPRSEIVWRLHCIVGIVVYLFAGVESSGIDQMLGDNLEENLERLLNVDCSANDCSDRGGVNRGPTQPGSSGPPPTRRRPTEDPPIPAVVCTARIKEIL